MPREPHRVHDQVNAVDDSIELGDRVQVCHNNFGESEWRVIGRNFGHKSYDLLSCDMAAAVQHLKRVPPEFLRRIDRAADSVNSGIPERQ